MGLIKQVCIEITFMDPNAGGAQIGGETNANSNPHL